MRIHRGLTTMLVAGLAFSLATAQSPADGRKSRPDQAQFAQPQKDAQAAQPPGNLNGADHSAPSARPAAKCPVTGDPIDRRFSTEFRGKQVYFATAAAAEQFKADPYAYADGLRAQWEALRPLRLQVLCPVTGKPIDPAISLTPGSADVSPPAEGSAGVPPAVPPAGRSKDPKGGVGVPPAAAGSVGVSPAGQSEDSKGSAGASPAGPSAAEPLFFATREARDAYAAHPERYAEKLASCYTFQVMCPCGAGESKPEVSLVHDGRTIYFCCPGCAKGFQHDPAVFMQELDARIEANRKAWESQQAGEKATNTK